MNRKDFLQASSLATAGLLLPQWLLAHGTPAAIPFGIQVYSVKDDMATDAAGTLRKLVTYGYKTIESFEGKEGFTWGMRPKEFKNFLADMGARCRSTHLNINENLEKKIGMAAEAGLDYVICPYLGAQKTIDDYKRFADKFNAAGRLARKAGLRFAYHNHDYSFKPLQGQIPQHVMLRNTDPALVDYEMDIYWVVTAGADPLAEVKKFPNRYRLCHVKQRMPDTTEQGASTQLESGVIDYGKLLRQLRALGMKYNLVEQERFDGTTALAAAEANAVFMKRLALNPGKHAPTMKKRGKS